MNFAPDPAAATFAATASLSAPATAIEYVIPSPVIEHATPAPVDVCTAPARLIEHVAPGVFTDFENQQFPVLAVEPATSQVVDSFSSGVEREQFAVEPSTSKAAVSFPAVDVSALPFYEQIQREQFPAEQFVESVKEIPQERPPVRIEELIGAPIVEETVEVAHSLPQERLQQRTMDQVLVLPTAEERVESVQIIQERIQQSIEEQIVPRSCRGAHTCSRRSVETSPCSTSSNDRARDARTRRCPCGICTCG